MGQGQGWLQVFCDAIDKTNRSIRRVSKSSYMQTFSKQRAADISHGTAALFRSITNHSSRSCPEIDDLLRKIEKNADAAEPLGDLGHTTSVLIPQFLRNHSSF